MDCYLELERGSSNNGNPSIKKRTAPGLTKKWFSELFMWLKRERIPRFLFLVFCCLLPWHTKAIASFRFSSVAEFNQKVVPSSYTPGHLHRNSETDNGNYCWGPVWPTLKWQTLWDVLAEVRPGTVTGIISVARKRAKKKRYSSSIVVSWYLRALFHFIYIFDFFGKSF